MHAPSTLPESPASPPSGAAAPRGLRGWYARLDRPGRIVLWVSLLNGLWRLVFVGFIHPPWKLDYSDMHSYLTAARDYADLAKPTDTGDWYYPSGTGASIAFWLLLFGKNVGEVVAGEFQALLSAIEVPLVYVIGKRFFDKRVGLVAAILLATHYLHMGFAGMFMSENYLTAGLVGAMALFVPESPRRSLLAGLALGYGAWAKSQAFLLAPLWALVLIFQKQYRSAALLMVGVLCFVVPVSIVATHKSGQPSFMSSNGGQTFALGHCPIRSMIYEHPTEHWRIYWSAPDLNQRIPRGEPEATWPDALFRVPFNHSSYYMAVGFDCIKRYPLHALRRELYHLADTFSGPPWSNIVPWPDSHTGFGVPAMLSNWVVAYLMAPLAFFALWAHRRERGVWLIFGLPVLSVIASALLFHGDPRFREPYDFCFFLVGARGALTLWERWRAGAAPASTAVEAQ